MEKATTSCVSGQRRDSLPAVLYDSVQEAARVNQRRLEQNIAFFRDNPEGLEQRLRELGEEWDVNRVLHVIAGAGALAGLGLALTKSRLWLLGPLAIAAGELHYGLTGQSLAADLVRRLGFRTRDEIEDERVALQALDAHGQ